MSHLGPTYYKHFKAIYTKTRQYKVQNQNGPNYDLKMKKVWYHLLVIKRCFVLDFICSNLRYNLDNDSQKQDYLKGIFNVLATSTGCYGCFLRCALANPSGCFLCRYWRTKIVQLIVGLSCLNRFNFFHDSYLCLDAQ